MDGPEFIKTLEKLRETLREAVKHKGERRTPLSTRTDLLVEYSYGRSILSKPPSFDHVRTTIVSEAYAPCLLPLEDLQKISLKDLQLETHHRNRVLIIRTFGHPVKLSAVMNVAEDEWGEVDRIAMYNNKATLEAAEVLPRGAVIAIKEPFFKASADKRCMIRVDHPSDAVFLDEDHLMYPEEWRGFGCDLKETATAWKVEGNAALKSNNHAKASDCYTRGLISASLEETELKRDLHRNRSFVNLLLGRYEAAKEDAIASLSGSDGEKSKLMDAKALYRAGCASYKLLEFSNAHGFFEQMLALSPDDEDGLKELQRTSMRLQEQQKGVYDLDAIFRAAMRKEANLLTDTASFGAGIATRLTEHRGRGVFTTRKFLPGDLILVEKAFLAVHDDKKHAMKSLMINLSTNRGSMGTQAALWADAVQRICDNPSSASRIFDLYAGMYPKGDSAPPVLDGMPAVDAFLVQRIIEHNAFAYTPARESGPYSNAAQTKEINFNSTGLWCQASYMNHSCLFNANRSFIGDLMIVRATKEIEQGTEITIPYRSIEADIRARQKLLQETWGFKCDCRLCASETQPNSTREALIKNSEAFVEKFQLNCNSLPSIHTFKRAEELVRDIEKTYSGESFLDMPHLAAIPVYRWLCQSCVLLQKHKELGDWAFALLRSHGYKVTVLALQVDIDRTNGILDASAVDALIYISDVYLQRGSTVLSKKFREIAEGMYKVINGVSAGFEERYGRS